jgi:hypothetical protein
MNKDAALSVVRVSQGYIHSNAATPSLFHAHGCLVNAHAGGAERYSAASAISAAAVGSS